MNRVLIILFTLLLSSQSFAKKQSLSYGIITKNGFCSATLIKAGGTCKLVTNAHCISDGEEKVILKSAADYLPEYSEVFAGLQAEANISPKFESRKSTKKDYLWRYEKNFFSERENREMEVRVDSFDRSKDLATLDVPLDVINGGCKELNELWMVDEDKITKEPTSIVLSGFTTNSKTGKPHVKVWHTRGTKYIGGMINEKPLYKSSKISLKTSTLENVENFLEVENIQMLPGNSGGTAHTSKGLFAGITTRFHPTQDKVYIIPASDVVKYALKPTQSKKSLDVKNTTEQVGGNGGTDGGGNGGTDGTGGNGGTDGTGGNGGTDGTGGNGGTDGTGGNGGTDGTGGNGGTDGTGCVKFGAPSIFVEPYEGYINDFGKIILAVGGNQIDGSDDLKDHKDGEVIARDASGYPALEIRKDILKRLSGEFTFKSKSKRYSEEKDHVLGWEEVTYGTGNTKINVDSKRITISKDLHTSNHSSNGSPVGMVHTLNNDWDRSYAVKTSSDYKTITLVSKDNVLTCDNRNYLKLICTGKDVTFSISRDSDKNGKASFRQTVDRSGVHTDYYFGNQ